LLAERLQQRTANPAIAQVQAPIRNSHVFSTVSASSTEFRRGLRCAAACESSSFGAGWRRSLWESPDSHIMRRDRRGLSAVLHAGLQLRPIFAARISGI